MEKEMIAKLKEAKSAEDVIAIAKEHGKELTQEQAQELYDKLKAAEGGELSDEDLEAVAGGWNPVVELPDRKYPIILY